MAKLWYACMKDKEDSDWGTGSFDLDEAKEMIRAWKEDSPEAYIAVIDGGYDNDGIATTDPVCVDTIEAEKDCFEQDIFHLYRAENNATDLYYVQRCKDYKCFAVDWDLSDEEEKELVDAFRNAEENKMMRQFIENSAGAFNSYEWEDEENVKGECGNTHLA